MDALPSRIGNHTARLPQPFQAIAKSLDTSQVVGCQVLGADPAQAPSCSRAFKACAPDLAHISLAVLGDRPTACPSQGDDPENRLLAPFAPADARGSDRAPE